MPDFESMSREQLEDFKRDTADRIAAVKQEKHDADMAIRKVRYAAALAQVETVLALDEPTIDDLALIDANEAAALHAHSRGRDGALPDTGLQKKVEEALVSLGYTVRVDEGGRTVVRRTLGLTMQRGSAA